MESAMIFGGIAAVLITLIVVALIARARRRKTSPFRPPTNIVLTTHARERMTQRNVSRDEIEAVLTAPQRVRRDEREDSYRLESDFPQGILKVWVTEWPAKDEVVVKSTAWNFTSTFSIPETSIGRVLGVGGAGIREIESVSGAKINVGRYGRVRVSAGDYPSLERARREIEKAAHERPRGRRA